MVTDELSRLTGLDVLRTYGTIGNMAKQTDEKYYNLRYRIMKALGSKLRDIEVSRVTYDGRTVIISPNNIDRYLKLFGLSSSDLDHGFLEHEVRLAIRKLDDSKEKQTVTGEEMRFIMKKTEKDYRIRLVGINLKYDPDKGGFPPLRFFGSDDES